MSLLGKLFGKSGAADDYESFWNWFRKHENEFHSCVKSGNDIERNFFAALSAALAGINDGFYFLAGTSDENTVELIFSTEGVVKNFVFAEEIVAAAPEIKGWKFTALKPAIDIENLSIAMAGYKFDESNLFFYANEQEEFPDKIDLSIVHSDLTEANTKEIINGTYVFLDNYLGELEFASSVDDMGFVRPGDATKDLVPIAKLKDFLLWREKEFVEKYTGSRHNTENDNYTLMEGRLENGNAMIAVVNQQLLNWDAKASHPWLTILTITYDGNRNNGMPDPKDYEVLNKMEDEITEKLRDRNGYLNVGRQTGNGEKEIYFACRDFRQPAKVCQQVKQRYGNRFGIEYEIYKDKYWQLVERFRKE